MTHLTKSFCHVSSFLPCSCYARLAAPFTLSFIPNKRLVSWIEGRFLEISICMLRTAIVASGILAMPYMPRTCQELAKNLPRQTMPASIDNLLRPDDVGQELPRGVGRRWSPPRGSSIEFRRPLRSVSNPKSTRPKSNFKCLTLSP